MKNPRISVFIASSILLAATSHAAVITFDSSQNFTVGDVAGQESWASTTGGWIVDPTGTGTVTATVASSNMTYAPSATVLSAASTYSFSTTFSVTGTFVSGSSLSTVASFGITTDATGISQNLVNGATSTTYASVGVQKGGGTVNFQNFRTLTDPGTVGSGFITVAPGDVLRLDFYLNLGTDGATSTWSGDITNITASTSATGTAKTGINETLFTALTTTGGYAFIQAQAPSAQGVTSVVVDTVSIVPEPSIFAMLGLGGLALLRRRR